MGINLEMVLKPKSKLLHQKVEVYELEMELLEPKRLFRLIFELVGLEIFSIKNGSPSDRKTTFQISVE